VVTFHISIFLSSTIKVVVSIVVVVQLTVKSQATTKSQLIVTHSDQSVVTIVNIQALSVASNDNAEALLSSRSQSIAVAVDVISHAKVIQVRVQSEVIFG
jgi:hypothetical protein